MCGIFGGYNLTVEQVETAINLIKRGNDGINIKSFNKKFHFASRRHLVKFSGKNENNNSSSDQPYYSDDKNISLIFNGEFYNYKNFKNNLIKEGINFKTSGDTEVFLKLYEKYGIDFLKDQNIDSLFSIAVYDNKKQKIFIARDWPGRIPLYYHHTKNSFVFSSELKAFRAIKNLSLTEPQELEPGYYIEVDIKNNKINKNCFFKVKPLKFSNNKILDISYKLHNLLNKSAKNRTMGDVPICTMLSGGIDSVLTTFYVLKNINFNKVSFKPTSYVMAVEGYDSIDVKKAEIAAKGFDFLNLKLTKVIIKKENIINDLPEIINSFEMRKLKALSFYPLPIYWFLAKKMKEDGFKVTIGGHGVDELLGAYDSWKELDKPHDLQTRSISRLAFINNIYDNMLKRASIIFMNRGPIEARFPFLSHKVCEFMLGIDKKWLTFNKKNTDLLLELIEKSNASKKLPFLKKNLVYYLDNNNFSESLKPKEISDIKKIFWKLPLIISSFHASSESFLPFELVFNPKHRGQHGAGITTLEKDIIKKYHKYGKNDKDIFLNLSKEIFK
tara:strand:- start:41 stop:1711 length:1671 start_codon:yes stop_codon:yes gene_type:complete